MVAAMEDPKLTRIRRRVEALEDTADALEITPDPEWVASLGDEWDGGGEKSPT